MIAFHIRAVLHIIENVLIWFWRWEIMDKVIYFVQDLVEGGNGSKVDDSWIFWHVDRHADWNRDDEKGRIAVKPGFNFHLCDRSRKIS
jgi:hypothetical protein